MHKHPSAEMPNEPMVITNSSRAVSIPLQLDEGSALRFHIDRNRASQLLVSGAVTGTSETVPSPSMAKRLRDAPGC